MLACTTSKKDIFDNMYALFCWELPKEKGESPYLGTDAMVVGGEAVAAVADGTSPQFAGIIHESMWVQNGSTCLAWYRIVVHDLQQNLLQDPAHRTPGFGLSISPTMSVLLSAIRFLHYNIAEVSDLYRNDGGKFACPAKIHQESSLQYV